jgi:hypothetical protein
MFLIMYSMLMDTVFSIYHHSIQMSVSLTTSGAMSSNGLDNRTSRISWMMCGNCEQWFAEISDRFGSSFVVTFRMQNNITFYRRATV